jgi:hypothetical protein
MKRLLLLSTVTLLLVIFIGGSAFATIARIRSLGNQDYFFKDIYHIYMNPAYLGSYTNTVYGELGYYYYYTGTEQYYTPNEQFLGINYKLYKGLSLGLTLNRAAETDFSYFGYNWSNYIPYPINEYDILASYDFEKLSLGLGLFHAGNKFEWEATGGTNPASYEGSSGTTALSGGFRYMLGEKHEIEGMLRLSFDRAKWTESGYMYTGSTGTLETDGGNGIEFGARGFFQVNDNFQVIPLVAYSSESMSLTGSGSMTSYATTGKLKESFLIIGLGGNLKLDKGMVAGGLNFYREKWVNETDTTSWTDDETYQYLPGFNLGVEYELTKWLVARVGMEKEFGRYEDKYHYGNSTWFYDYKSRFSDPNSQDFIGLGVGFKFSKFQVDATVGEDNLYEGTYLLSGIQRNLFGNMSVVFTF